MIKRAFQAALRAILLALFVASSAHASVLWDFTITAYAYSSGQIGLQSATYRYNLDDLVYVECLYPCDPSPPFPPLGEGGIHGYRGMIGPVLSVTYRGLVNGVRGPMTIYGWTNNLEAETHLGGTGSQTPLWETLLHPVESVGRIDLILSWNLQGGGPGFEWAAVSIFPRGDIDPDDWLHATLAFAPVRLAEPGTLALLAVFLVGIAASSRARA